MAQHFLLSAKARTISLKTVFQMGEDAAYQTFKEMRWPETNGDPVCPECGCLDSYNITTRKRFKCAACYRQFSVTSGTIFASRKLSYTDLLAAIVIFMNGVKGVSALQVSRDLNVQYKTAFVLAHKLREAMTRELSNLTLSGTVEVDGAYFGGYSKPANERKDRKDRRLTEHQTGKRKVVVIMRERNGRSLPHICRSEKDAVPIIRERVAAGSTIVADESTAYDPLHARYETQRVNHSQRFMENGVSTNWAESYFSRLRRAEIGTHHHIAGPYFDAYAGEMSWREDRRKISNGDQVKAVGSAAMASPQSRKWSGYWQRRAA